MRNCMFTLCSWMSLTSAVSACRIQWEIFRLLPCLCRINVAVSQRLESSSSRSDTATTAFRPRSRKTSIPRACAFSGLWQKASCHGHAPCDTAIWIIISKCADRLGSSIMYWAKRRLINFGKRDTCVLRTHDAKSDIPFLDDIRSKSGRSWASWDSIPRSWIIKAIKR